MVLQACGLYTRARGEPPRHAKGAKDDVPAGDPEIMEAVREVRRTLDQIELEEVRQDPQTLQALMRRHDAACRRMVQAAMEGACCGSSPPLQYHSPSVHMELRPAQRPTAQHTDRQAQCQVRAKHFMSLHQCIQLDGAEACSQPFWLVAAQTPLTVPVHMRI